MSEPGRAAAGRRRRDRRGRGPRGPLAWPPVPAMASRSNRFDDLVLDSAARLGHHLQGAGEVEFAVEDVPPAPPAGRPGEVSLGRLYPGNAKRPTRIVVYRRPVESRTGDDRELAALVHDVVIEQVAAHLGLAPEDLDPRYGG